MGEVEERSSFFIEKETSCLHSYSKKQRRLIT